MTYVNGQRSGTMIFQPTADRQGAAKSGLLRPSAGILDTGHSIYTQSPSSSELACERSAYNFSPGAPLVFSHGTWRLSWLISPLVFRAFAHFPFEAATIAALTSTISLRRALLARPGVPFPGRFSDTTGSERALSARR
jgi:hypothetical protein